MIDFWSISGRHKDDECLILGNGESFPQQWAKHVLRDDYAAGDGPVVIGLNQSWKLAKDVDYHLTIDKSHYDRHEPQEGYAPDANKRAFQALDKRGILFTSEAWKECTPRQIGIPIPMLGFPWTWGRFEQEPRGLVTSIDGSGSVMFVALQLAELMGFERIWLCGFDQTGPKFTGETSKHQEDILKRQDWLFKHTPAKVVEKVRVIAPSKTTAFKVVEEWPW